MIGPDVGGNTNKSSTDWLWEWAYRSDGGASNDKYIHFKFIFIFLGSIGGFVRKIFADN